MVVDNYQKCNGDKLSGHLTCRYIARSLPENCSVFLKWMEDGIYGNSSSFPLTISLKENTNHYMCIGSVTKNGSTLDASEITFHKQQSICAHGKTTSVGAAYSALTTSSTKESKMSNIGLIVCTVLGSIVAIVWAPVIFFYITLWYRRYQLQKLCGSGASNPPSVEMSRDKTGGKKSVKEGEKKSLVNKVESVKK